MRTGRFRPHELGARPATVESVARHAWRVAADRVQRAQRARAGSAPTRSRGCSPRSSSSGTGPTRPPASCAPSRPGCWAIARPARDGVSESGPRPLPARARGDRAGRRLSPVLFTAADPRRPSSTSYDDLIRTTAVDAFVLSGTHYDDPRQRWLRRRGAPFVAFGRPWGSAKTTLLGRRRRRRAAQRRQSTIWSTAGHRRIAFVGWPPDSGVGDDRLEGWRAAMRRHAAADARLRRSRRRLAGAGRRVPRHSCSTLPSRRPRSCA